jgi:DNA-binding transcriptional LysR family regulator
MAFDHSKTSPTVGLSANQGSKISAVSKSVACFSIRRLAGELAIGLSERLGGNISLTEYGMRLLRSASELADRAQSRKKEPS